MPRSFPCIHATCSRWVVSIGWGTWYTAVIPEPRLIESPYHDLCILYNQNDRKKEFWQFSYYFLNFNLEVTHIKTAHILLIKSNDLHFKVVRKIQLHLLFKRRDRVFVNSSSDYFFWGFYDNVFYHLDFSTIFCLLQSTYFLARYSSTICLSIQFILSSSVFQIPDLHVNLITL